MGLLNRIPFAAVHKVEVVRGATGDLYGAGALGGVVQLLTLQPSRTRARVTMDGGSHPTFRGSGFGSYEREGWNLAAAFEGVNTDGVCVVGSDVRGPIDAKASSDYTTGYFSGGRRVSAWHANLRGGWLRGGPRQRHAGLDHLGGPAVADRRHAGAVLWRAVRQ